MTRPAAEDAVVVSFGRTGYWLREQYEDNHGSFADVLAMLGRASNGDSAVRF